MNDAAEFKIASRDDAKALTDAISALREDPLGAALARALPRLPRSSDQVEVAGSRSQIMEEPMDWAERKRAIEDREPEESDMSHLAEAIWDRGVAAWLDAYSEYARVKGAAIDDPCWDAEAVVWKIGTYLRYEIQDRFGRGTLDRLEERVRVDRNLPISPEKIANAKEFCRPFEDHLRRLAATPVPEALWRQAEEELRQEIAKEQATAAGDVDAIAVAEVQEASGEVVAKLRATMEDLAARAKLEGLALDEVKRLEPPSLPCYTTAKGG